MLFFFPARKLKNLPDQQEGLSYKRIFQIKNLAKSQEGKIALVIPFPSLVGVTVIVK